MKSKKKGLIPLLTWIMLQEAESHNVQSCAEESNCSHDGKP